jgi:hypothetical protein
VFRGIPLPDAIHSFGGVSPSSVIPADRPDESQLATSFIYALVYSRNFLGDGASAQAVVFHRDQLVLMLKGSRTGQERQCSKSIYSILFIVHRIVSAICYLHLLRSWNSFITINLIIGSKLAR